MFLEEIRVRHKFMLGLAENVIKCLSWLYGWLSWLIRAEWEIIDMTHTLSGDMFISRVSLPSLVVGVSWFKGGGVSCVHLEETDFYVLILWCEEKKKGCVGVKYEDWYILLSAGEVCKENSLAYFCSYRSMQMKGLSPFFNIFCVLVECSKHVSLWLYFTFSLFVDPVPTLLKPCYLINVHRTLTNSRWCHSFC